MSWCNSKYFKFCFKVFLFELQNVRVEVVVVFDLELVIVYCFDEFFGGQVDECQFFFLMGDWCKGCIICNIWQVIGDVYVFVFLLVVVFVMVISFIVQV